MCKEAAMRPVRKIFDALENHTEGNKTFTMQAYLAYYQQEGNIEKLILTGEIRMIKKIRI